MDFTALHRHLGHPPGPITDDLVDAAITAGLAETDDLDWKSELPPAKDLTRTDFPKDIAAMANSGGGTIVYGVEESQKQATGRRDVGVLEEGHERALRSVAITGISPPVFGLGVHRLGKAGAQAVAVVVPASVDGPHLIYKGEYFGAPIRNDADTVWMKERQVEAMYRARFDERRHAFEALANLYTEAATGRDIHSRAWMIAVAYPCLPHMPPVRPSRDDAGAIFAAAVGYGVFYAGRGGIHPLGSVDRLNPRPGLRRWTAANTATGTSQWRESWVSVHHDGSVSLATAIGGQRTEHGTLPGERICSAGVECAVADVMGLIRAVGEHWGTSEYDVRVGIEWAGTEPLVMETQDRFGLMYDGSSTPLARFVPVDVTVTAGAEALDFYWQVHDLAQDCINQGGLTAPRMISPPERE